MLQNGTRGLVVRGGEQIHKVTDFETAQKNKVLLQQALRMMYDVEFGQQRGVDTKRFKVMLKILEELATEISLNV